jgi:hypothetical protein
VQRSVLPLGGALAAAKELGLKTGGTAPRGYRTDDGPNIDLCLIYGLEASFSSNYATRTATNVLASDGTLLFGRLDSAGTRLTRELCQFHNKSFIHIFWIERHQTVPSQFIEWLHNNNIKILNVAGNRERKNPGISQATKNFLIDALRDVL